MKGLVLDGISCHRSHLWVVFIRVLIVVVLIPCSSLTLLSCLTLAANEEALKDVQLSSPETDASIRDQRRVALVIGNSDYKVGVLQDPANDAEDISEVLRTLGFAVQIKTNVDQCQMEEAVNRFVGEIKNGDVALFYFSGYGVQLKGENYLIPLGGSIESEADVHDKAVNVGSVLLKMEESRNRTNIVILDSFRNNPFREILGADNKGLSPLNAPKGTFIAFATAPNSITADGLERNSPYTKHLIEALKMKDVPIELAFKQVTRSVTKETGGEQAPWTSSFLLEDFCFNPSSSAGRR